MKILLVNNNYKIHGGAEFFVHEVERVLVNNGHDVSYFCAASDGDTSEWKSYFPDVVDYKQGSVMNRVLSFHNMVYSTGVKKSLEQLIADFKPDLVHVFAIYVKLTPSVLDAARNAGVPIVMSCNDYKHICPNYKLFHHGRLCEDCYGGNFFRAILNKCSHDSFIYSTANALEAYVHNYFDIYKKNIHTFLFASQFMLEKTRKFWGDGFKHKILRNPFDSQKYQFSFAPQGPILYFGRLIEEKGVSLIIESAVAFPNVKFRIVGEGPDFANISQLISKYNLRNVELVGPKWGDEIDNEIQSCRFVVVPSIWHENFPYVILQSFAHGKAVVGSNRGGIPELVADGERGRIFDPDIKGSMTDAITALSSSDELLREMGLNCKKYVDDNFNDEMFYKTLIDIYQEVSH